MKTVIVLGMRSGSSMTARALHLSREVHMGSELFIAESESQPRGHYENEKFLHFNGDLLRSLGYEWDNFPNREFVKSIRHKHENTIKRMIEESMLDAEKNGYESWGWKDPRTIILIDLYLPYLTNPKFICCYRKPMDVADSLLRRDNTPIERGLEIARMYNERLHEFMTEWLELD